MFARILSTLLAITTFALVLLGGLVHTRGASLACPDWPLCYGMVFPPMQGDILLEHSHRLLASGVGVMSLLLWFTVSRLQTPMRAFLTRTAGAGVALVILQGCLGGITVLLRLPPLVSVAHWSMSMLFFAWAVCMALLVRQATAPADAVVGHPLAMPGRKGVAIAAGFVYAQGILGAAVRHTHSSMSCGQQALGCGDGWLPQTGPQWLQTSHRLMAVLALVLVIATTIPALRAARLAGNKAVRRLGVASHVLLLLQITMGILTLTTGIHLHVVMTHVAFGALLWAALAAMTLLMGPNRCGGKAHQGAAGLAVAPVP